MKHFRLARLLPCLLISLCPALLGHCGGALEHSTETGNPPVVEQQKLHVVLREDGVEVVGEAGAVSPGASVAVTNTRTGARSEASAGSDGSVSVSVPGTLDDEYELTVTSAGGSQTVRVSASAGSGAAGAGGTSAGSEFASASCAALEQTLSERVAAGYAGARACQADSDCTMGDDVGCYYFACNWPVVSVTGAQAAQQAILEDTAPVCGELTRRCGPRGPMRCPFMPVTPGCVSGSCQALSCDELQSRLYLQTSDISNADGDCSVDADCTIISASVRCTADCGNWHSVPTRIASAVTEQIRSAESVRCSEYENLGCPQPEPLPCILPFPTTTNRAICLANRCQIESVPVP